MSGSSVRAVRCARGPCPRGALRTRSVSAARATARATTLAERGGGECASVRRKFFAAPPRTIGWCFVPGCPSLLPPLPIQCVPDADGIPRDRRLGDGSFVATSVVWLGGGRSASI